MNWSKEWNAGQNLRSLANRYSKELGCRFVVVKWNDANIYEVAKKEL